MIIKSLSRKSGFADGKNPFRSLIRYMNRGIEQEEGEPLLWQNFYGSESSLEADILAEFEANTAHLPERKNGNVLYHEILSFSSGHTLDRKTLLRTVADVGQEYLRQRAPEQLAYGVVHLETDHIHLHLMISANRVQGAERVRLSRKDFSEAQKSVERYTLTRYPELKQTIVYDRDLPERIRLRGERSKTRTQEQDMKVRTGEPSRKDALKGRLHHLFEQAKSLNDLMQALEREQLKLYTRGKSIGIIERIKDGGERKHRLATLGLLTHYETIQSRFRQLKIVNIEKEPFVSEPTRPESTFDTEPKWVKKVDEVIREEARFSGEVIKDFVFGTERSDRAPNHEKTPAPPAQKSPVFNTVQQPIQELARDAPSPPTPVPPMTDRERRIAEMRQARDQAKDKDRDDRDR